MLKKLHWILLHKFKSFPRNHWRLMRIYADLSFLLHFFRRNPCAFCLKAYFFNVFKMCLLKPFDHKNTVHPLGGLCFAVMGKNLIRCSPGYEPGERKIFQKNHSKNGSRADSSALDPGCSVFRITTSFAASTLRNSNRSRRRGSGQGAPARRPGRSPARPCRRLWRRGN